MANLIKEISGDQAVQAAIATIPVRARGRGLWLAIGEEVRGQVEERFDTSTAPDGSKWPLSWRVKLGLGGGPTLVNTGDMRRSMTVNAAEAGGELVVPKRQAAALHFGATIVPKTKKALKFQLGMKGNAPNFIFSMRSKIPPRPFLGFNPQNIADIVETARAYILMQGSGAQGAAP